MAAPRGPAAYVEVDGIEYEARDYAWESHVLQLADQWSVTVPAPNGQMISSDGRRVRAGELREGALVKFFLRDPAVRNGAVIQKLTGRLVTIDDSEDARSGYVVRLSGFDLGWHLTTGCGRVFENLRGVTFQRFLERNVLDPSLGWGFAGVRAGNLANKRFRQGRAGINAQLQEDTSPIVVRFQLEVGEPLAPKLIEYARREGYLLNVSADGWLQFFKPVVTEEPSYTFHHRLAGDAVGSEFNRVRNTRLRRSAEGLYTVVQCWTTVIDTTDLDPFDPNAGRYYGEFVNLGTLPFSRRNTFSDPDQIGDAAKRRARWAWQRGRSDSWEYSLRTIGHSQDGVAFEPDTVAYLRDDVRGLDGNYYVLAVRFARQLAAAGLSPDVGSYSDITLRPLGMLNA